MRHFKELSDRERAIFEAGVTLGAIYHQFSGTPVSPETARDVARCIERAAELQPCVERVSVDIDVSERDTENYGGYTEVSGRNLRVRLVTRCGDWEAVARLEYVEELEYPLMWIEEVRRVRD
ncbi:MAG: dihydroneopterin aldolase family protein [Euryarchaeota archaeon]